jgi:hypothetical protein
MLRRSLSLVVPFMIPPRGRLFILIGQDFNSGENSERDAKVRNPP